MAVIHLLKLRQDINSGKSCTDFKKQVKEASFLKGIGFLLPSFEEKCFKDKRIKIFSQFHTRRM